MFRESLNDRIYPSMSNCGTRTSVSRDLDSTTPFTKLPRGKQSVQQENTVRLKSPIVPFSYSLNKLKVLWKSLVNIMFILVLIICLISKSFEKFVNRRLPQNLAKFTLIHVDLKHFIA